MLIEPLALASALPSGILPLGSSFMLAVPIVGLLSIAVVGLLCSLPRRRQQLRALRLVHSTAA